MSSQVCHGMHNGVIQNIQADLPCGVTNSSHPYVTCCVNGDYCLSNSICVNTNDKDGDYYYAADCTDETLTDPACGTRCGGRNSAEIVYTSDGYWACCENSYGTVNCSNPSDEIFPGVAPSKLATIQYLPSTASGTPTYAVASSTSTSDSSNANTTTTSSSSSSTSSSSSASSGIGAGAAAGIGVGAAAGFVIVAAILALLYFRRRKAQNNVLPQGAGGYNGLGDGSWAQTQPVAHPVYELDRTGPHPELDGQPKVM
ncbi:uncharacterized protein AKAW2_51998S [Aspergillus luchuensis]|uniref:Similar to An06g00470 n=1 Tax=Aspergillus kawachii TaxID=1069201 RepID=A0A146F9S1_ASPKA|nr:uncharacterized protein AKAW2_51998S [Aspergillus luchuensis]BCS01657.1 hypothetical protein AKAW2_51998S [Aspergillus luchuensis]BCS13368.1 hypothetical protein ALUC_51414S [Aspergillus luchuensis]GAA88071.1 similar to An06g00470 [Aspergillus luchuensis IFO 4308]GAT22668.1 similar to An06g00470 [Aspergillus luchuensis]